MDPDNWWWISFLLVGTCAFWLGCAAFAGLCAGFFWARLDLDPDVLNVKDELHLLTRRSVVTTWAPTALFCCAWVVLWIPFLLYLWVFRLAVAKAIPFWNSNRPGQWLGDFSDLGEKE